MDKKRDDAEPLSIVDIADRKLIEERFGHTDVAIRRLVVEVLDASDPDARFIELAKVYLGNQGKTGESGRSAGITYLAWAFGAEKRRPELKKFLRWKGIVGAND